MMLIENTAVPTAALPLPAFKDHLRLGTGFVDDGGEDALLEALLRAAIAAVEGRTGKVFLARSYTWVVNVWRSADRQALPVAPVASITSLRLVDPTGNSTVVLPETYSLVQDRHVPCVVGRGGALPSIPTGGAAEIDFDAGFGMGWDAVPHDLGHAVFLLAAHYYEHRHETAVGKDVMPFGVVALSERWRRVRLGAGGVR